MSHPDPNLRAAANGQPDDLQSSPSTSHPNPNERAPVTSPPDDDHETGAPRHEAAALGYGSPALTEERQPAAVYTAPIPVVAEPAMAAVPKEATSSARPMQQVAADLGVDRASVVAREKERFGGMKIGSAFFGWMAAAGVAVLLLALLTATGVALGTANHTTAADISNQATAATGTARTIGLIGAIAVLIIIFIAYYCGGYVAGRMARFNGTKQGLAVWLWSLFFAVIIAILVAVFGSKFNVLSTLNLPSLPVGKGNTTVAGIIGIAAVVLVSLGAALLGGAAGMLYHRKVDRTGLAV